jgi:hypothetical protein
MAADGESFRVITRSLAIEQSHVFYRGEAAEFATPGDLDVLAMADSVYFGSRQDLALWQSGKDAKTRSRKFHRDHE